MAYTAVTPTLFKGMKPQFAAVQDAVVQVYLDLAGEVAADDSWPSQSVYTFAITSYACHLMTLDGLGTDAESEDQGNGTSAFQTIKSADLTLTRYAKAASGSSYQDWLGGTKCGAFYLQLLRQNRGGPHIIMGGPGGCASPYAKDQPLPWPYSFGGPLSS